MKIFDPNKPRISRALLTLRYAKKLNATTPDTVTQEVLDAATKHLCASGVSATRAKRAMLNGGSTKQEADTQVDNCYPTLPLVSGQ